MPRIKKPLSSSFSHWSSLPVVWSVIGHARELVAAERLPTGADLEPVQALEGEQSGPLPGQGPGPQAEHLQVGQGPGQRGEGPAVGPPLSLQGACPGTQWLPARQGKGRGLWRAMCGEAGGTEQSHGDQGHPVLALAQTRVAGPRALRRPSGGPRAPRGQRRRALGR